LHCSTISIDFVDLTGALQAEEEARDGLLKLQTEIEKAEQQVQRIPEYERLLATTRQQLAALQKPDVKGLIDLQRHVATERELRNEVTMKLRGARDDLAAASPRETVALICELADPVSLAVGALEFKAIKEAAQSFVKAAETAEQKSMWD
jgi:hypothetical protein